MLLDPFGDLWQVLVLLSDVVLFAKVDEVDCWLRRKQEERIDDLDLLLTSATASFCVSESEAGVFDVDQKGRVLMRLCVGMVRLSKSWDYRDGISCSSRKGV